jgi:hypothetical protein
MEARLTLTMRYVNKGSDPFPFIPVTIPLAVASGICAGIASLFDD